jgi:hypothetical protein
MKNKVWISIRSCKIESGTATFGPIPLNGQIHELVKTEAFGWAVPLPRIHGSLHAGVWFGTSLGNDRVDIDPQSIWHLLVSFISELTMTVKWF